MRIGFTGTRKGMSASQKQQLAWLFLRLKLGDVPEFHHGGAVGADAEAASFAAKNPGIHIHVHPASAYESPLIRNREIVDETEILIAAPRTDREELRSGTWATVRYARKAGKPVVMLSRGDD